MIKNFFLSRVFVEINGDLFEILKKIEENKNPVIDAWKQRLSADRVFRREGYIFFCRIVEEAKIDTESNGQR